VNRKAKISLKNHQKNFEKVFVYFFHDKTTAFFINSLLLCKIKQKSKRKKLKNLSTLVKI